MSGSQAGGRCSIEINIDTAARVELGRYSSIQLRKTSFSGSFFLPGFSGPATGVTQPSAHHSPRGSKVQPGHLGIFSFSKYRDTYYIPAPMLGTEDRVMSKTQLCSSSLFGAYHLIEKQTLVSVSTHTSVCYAYMCVYKYISIYIYTYIIICICLHIHM